MKPKPFLGGYAALSVLTGFGWFFLAFSVFRSVQPWDAFALTFLSAAAVHLIAISAYAQRHPE